MSPEQFAALMDHIDGAVRRAAIDIANALMGRLASIDARLGRIEANQMTLIETVRGHSSAMDRVLSLVPDPISADCE